MPKVMTGNELINLAMRKGLQAVTDLYARNLNHVEIVLNLFIKEVVNANPADLENNFDRVGVVCCLLEAGFFELRVSVERKRPMALALMERLQAIIARDIVRTGKNLAARELLMDALKEARVELMPLLKSAMEKHPKDVLDDDEEPLTLEEANDSLTATICFAMSQHNGNVFAVAREILNSSEGLSVLQSKNFILTLLNLEDLPVAQEISLFFVLDQRAEVRRFALENFACTNPKVFSGDFSRRLKTICNWLPNSEKKIVDTIIKNIGNSVSDGSQLPIVQKLQFIATGVDGSGSWGIIGIGKRDKQNWQFGFLCRIGAGIRDVWVSSKVTAVRNKELASKCKHNDMPIHGKLSVDAFVVLMNYGIAAGLKQGILPSFDVLEILELLGVTRPLDSFPSFDHEIDRIRNQKSTLALDTSPLANFLEFKSLNNHFMFESWFEDDIEVDQIVHSICVKKTKKSQIPLLSKIDAMNKIVSEVVLKRTEKWSRCLMLVGYLSEHLKVSEYPKASACVAYADHLVAGNEKEPQALLQSIGMKSVVASLSRNG